MTKLWRQVEGPVFARNTVDTVEKAMAGGAHIAGSPDTVTETGRADRRAGGELMVIAFNIGNMAHEDAMRSITMFGEEVMPKLQCSNGDGYAGVFGAGNREMENPRRTSADA